MGKKYNTNFTGMEQEAFAETHIFGMHMQQLKQFLGFSKLQRDTVMQPGLPSGHLNNDLANWIYEARKSAKRLHDRELRIAIKADQKESYTLIAKTIALLQAQRINRFSLVTTIKHRTYDN